MPDGQPSGGGAARPLSHGPQPWAAVVEAAAARAAAVEGKPAGVAVAGAGAPGVQSKPAPATGAQSRPTGAVGAGGGERAHTTWRETLERAVTAWNTRAAEDVAATLPTALGVIAAWRAPLPLFHANGKAKTWTHA